MSGPGHLPNFAHLELLTAWCRPESDQAPWGGISTSSTNSRGSSVGPDRIGRSPIVERQPDQSIAGEIEITGFDLLQAKPLHGAELGLEPLIARASQYPYIGQALDTTGPRRWSGSVNASARLAAAFARSWWSRSRKLLIALWRFVIDGVMPEGAVTKPSI
jgi:hypothetical protein